MQILGGKFLFGSNKMTPPLRDDEIYRVLEDIRIVGSRKKVDFFVLPPPGKTKHSEM